MSTYGWHKVLTTTSEKNAKSAAITYRGTYGRGNTRIRKHLGTYTVECWMPDQPGDMP